MHVSGVEINVSEPWEGRDPGLESWMDRSFWVGGLGVPWRQRASVDGFRRGWG